MKLGIGSYTFPAAYTTGGVLVDDSSYISNIHCIVPSWSGVTGAFQLEIMPTLYSTGKFMLKVRNSGNGNEVLAGTDLSILIGMVRYLIIGTPV